MIATQFALLALAAPIALASPHPAPAAGHNGVARLPTKPAAHIRVPLKKRGGQRGARTLTKDGIADLTELNSLLKGAKTKFSRGARRYHERTGRELPGFKLAEDVTGVAAGVVDAATNVVQGALGALGLGKRQNQVLTEYEDGLLWAGPVSIGTPPQEFTINFDTGSSDFWVPDSSVSNGHNTYNAAASSTRTDSNDTFGILYGDGSNVQGKVYQDTVTVAGLAATQQHFASATTVSASFTDDPGDGVLGLGFESISNIGETPYFNTLFEQGVVPEQVFSFELGKGNEGELFLGGTDPSRYSGEITYTPVTQASYWMIKGNAFVNGNLTSSAKDQTNMIVDTGTTLIVIPPVDAEAFFARVPKAKPFQNGFYQFPCGSRWTASFSLAGSDRRFNVSSEFMNLGLTAAGSTWCVAAIAAQDVGINAWILGDVFLRNVYSVYDFNGGAPRVGIATLA